MDDEPQLLQALQVALRRQRHRWDVVCASGGQEALDALARAPCHVVVTDMLMPGMNGLALLERVGTDHPAVARVMLSGRGGPPAGTPHSAQIILEKPCCIDRLVATIERAIELHSSHPTSAGDAPAGAVHPPPGGKSP